MACNRYAQEFATSVEWLRNQSGDASRSDSDIPMVERQHTQTTSTTSKQTTVDLRTARDREESDDWIIETTPERISSPDRRLVRSMDRSGLRFSSDRRVQRMENDPMDESMVRWKSYASEEERFSDSEDDEYTMYNPIELQSEGSLSSTKPAELCFLRCPGRSSECNSHYCAISDIHDTDLGTYDAFGRFHLYPEDYYELGPDTQEDLRCSHDGDCSDDEYH